jgi:hypothetical protein
MWLARRPLGERVSADDEEANVSGGECSQQIEKVRIHRQGRRVGATAPD